MKTYQYRLGKTEYLDWIRWMIAQRDDLARRKRMLLLLLVVLVAVLGIEALLFRSKPQIIPLSAGFGLVILTGFSGILSKKNKERALWIQNGLDRVEKANAYPVMTLTLRHAEFHLASDRDERQQTYRYDHILEIVELDHILMVKTGDEKWQLIANNAFQDSGERAEALRALRGAGGLDPAADII